MRILDLVAGIALLSAVSGAALGQECAPDRVDIRYGDTQVSFTVDVVDTPESRAQGLMFREEMADDAGMLFIYESPHTATFWMKNTLISLDMLFVSYDGIVLNIKKNATPLSEDVIPGGPGILEVLEINGGLVDELGLGIGAQMRHPSLDQRTAAWACE